MESKRKTARIAGALYLLMAVTGFFGIMYVPSAIIVSGHARATVSNILASELLFRTGIVSNLFCPTTFIFFSDCSLPAIYRSKQKTCFIDAGFGCCVSADSIPQHA